MNVGGVRGYEYPCTALDAGLHGATVEKQVSNQTGGKFEEDTRKAYEAPRVLIKRSVAKATLVTAPGPTGGTLTASG
jgi:hypothetical protein